MTFINDDDEPLALLVQFDDVIAQQFHQILHAADADGQREIEFRKNLAQQSGLAEAGRHEHEHGVIFGPVEVLEEQLRNERFARAARAGDHAERGLKLHREQHVPVGLGVALGAEKEAGIHAVGKRIFAQSVIADEISRGRKRDDFTGCGGRRCGDEIGERIGVRIVSGGAEFWERWVHGGGFWLAFGGRKKRRVFMRRRARRRPAARGAAARFP